MSGLINIKNVPFNLNVLQLKPNEIQTIPQIKTLEIFSNKTNNFHPEGLFSVEYFGPVGSELRNRRLARIHLKDNYIHPILYHLIIKTSPWYEGIIKGTTYALWNDKEKIFEKSSIEEGQTGFSFFMKHISQHRWVYTNSIKREFNIHLIEKMIQDKTHLITDLIVLPAGLRDYTIDKYGKPSEDEINGLYRKVLGYTIALGDNVSDVEVPYFDRIKASIQTGIYDVFLYIKSLLEGKSKFIQGKWLSRKTFNSTRNVASSYIEKAEHADDPKRLKFNEAAVGLYQFSKVLMPKTAYNMKAFLTRLGVFVENTNTAYLPNAKTLLLEEINLEDMTKDYDMFMSIDGVDKLIYNFSNSNIRHLPVELNKEKHYLLLIYDDGKYFKYIRSIDELPDGFDKKYVRPVTLTDLLYGVLKDEDSRYHGFITRYPITGYGSIYPAKIKLYTTTEMTTRTELTDEWNVDSPDNRTYYNYPIKDLNFHETVNVHPTHNARLGLDFDGDVISVQVVLTEEANREIQDKLDSLEYYLDSNNEFYFSISNDILQITLAYMTGDPAPSN